MALADTHVGIPRGRWQACPAHASQPQAPSWTRVKLHSFPVQVLGLAAKDAAMPHSPGSPHVAGKWLTMLFFALQAPRWARLRPPFPSVQTAEHASAHLSPLCKPLSTP